MPCDPLRDLRAWQERLERLAAAQHDTAAWTPPIDVYETADWYVVTAEVPGLTREALEIGVDGSRLTLSGSRPGSAAGGARRFHQVERGHGRFSRTFEFADTIAADAVSADLRDGVLTITLPKVTPPVRKIEVL